MKECKTIKKMLVAYRCKELETSEIECIERHLGKCSGCKKEFDSVRLLVDHVENLKNQNEEIIQRIDWGKNALQVTIESMRSASSVPRYRFFPLIGWQVLAPILASVFIFGVLAGYFLFHPAKVDEPYFAKAGYENLSFSRIETTLTRKQILEYFKQIQLLLLDLVKQCEKGAPVVLTGGLNQFQVSQLLGKNRYLSQALNEPQLMSTRNLLKNIELLLYEILIMIEHGSCRDVQRLQNIIRQERIFLKIRLIEKDLSSGEV